MIFSQFPVPMLWNRSHMFSDKKAAVTACSQQIYQGWRPPSCERILACPHYRPDTHVLSKKSHQMGPIQFRRISQRVPFSKTLISGPQISCQSSAVDRHRIGGERQSPTNQQHVNQTHKHVLAPIHTRRCTQTRARTHTRTYTHTGTGGCVLHAITLPPSH